MKIPKKKELSPTEERYRSSHMTLKVTSFGNEAQHQKTLQSILNELELRGYDNELVMTKPINP